jgi:hypothetical protein
MGQPYSRTCPMGIVVACTTNFRNGSGAPAPMRPRLRSMYPRFWLYLLALCAKDAAESKKHAPGSDSRFSLACRRMALWRSHFLRTALGATERAWLFASIRAAFGSWVGNFERGATRYNSVLAHPDGRQVVIVAGGEGYIIAPETPSERPCFTDDKPCHIRPGA